MDYKEVLNSNKKVTEADRKFVEKYIAPHFYQGQSLVYNPVTEWEKRSTVLIGTLVLFVQQLSFHDFSRSILGKWGVPEGQKIQLFDRARYLILKLDSEIYSNVID
jgi:hypothetical protein